VTESLDTCDGLPADTPAPAGADMPPDVPALKMFYLYLSAGCNLHCRHCWITPTFVHGQPVPGESLDFELLKGAVAEAKPMGLSAAKLTGGEPVLHPRFLEIVDFLTAEGLDLSMETNGTLIDRDMAVHLYEKTNLKRVSVSLDSPDPAEHDRFRGVKGPSTARCAAFAIWPPPGFRHRSSCPSTGATRAGWKD
jgi:MoaA/NifB/PqqE/SkfB family radical SAM enzyme